MAMFVKPEPKPNNELIWIMHLKQYKVYINDK